MLIAFHTSSEMSKSLCPRFFGNACLSTVVEVFDVSHMAPIASYLCNYNDSEFTSVPPNIPYKYIIRGSLQTKAMTIMYTFPWSYQVLQCRERKKER